MGGWKWVASQPNDTQGSWYRKPDKIHPKTGVSKSAYIPCKVCEGWKWAHRVNKTHCDKCGTKYGDTQAPKGTRGAKQQQQSSAKPDDEKAEEDEKDDDDDDKSGGATDGSTEGALSDLSGPGCAGLLAILNFVSKDPAINRIPGVSEAITRLNEAAAGVSQADTSQDDKAPSVTLSEAKKTAAEATKVWRQIMNQMDKKKAKVK